MMDYLTLIQTIRQKYNMAEAPAITFGGSYGGMLASWMRMKFPSYIQGAVVSGAPILYFKGSTTTPTPVFY